MYNSKNIHIGHFINERVKETNIEEERICKYLKCSKSDIKQMYNSESLDSDILLKWSKILEYDFFRIYSQHLILYSPPKAISENIKLNKETYSKELPRYRKNIYTRDIIDFILESVRTGRKTKNEIITEYNIPKTTLYKWIEKYNKEN